MWVQLTPSAESLHNLYKCVAHLILFETFPPGASLTIDEEAIRSSADPITPRQRFNKLWCM
jgi:hypothetical protein